MKKRENVTKVWIIDWEQILAPKSAEPKCTGTLFDDVHDPIGTRRILDK